MNRVAQCGHKLGLEPRIFLEPSGIAPRGMRQGDGVWQMVAPLRGGVGDVACAQVPGLGRSADDQAQFDIGQGVHDACVPCLAADFGRWQVGAFGGVAGKAEGHGDDGDVGFVVELRRREAEPVAQSVAGGIVEGDAGFMDAHAGGLACDEEACGGREPRDGAWFVGRVGGGETVGAEGAGGDLLVHLAEFRGVGGAAARRFIAGFVGISWDLRST